MSNPVKFTQKDFNLNVKRPSLRKSEKKTVLASEKIPSKSVRIKGSKTGINSIKNLLTPEFL